MNKRKREGRAMATGWRWAAAGLVAAFLTGTVGAKAQDAPLVFGLPGIPPVFTGVQEYVARDAGFFKKYGLTVTLRQFDTGVAAARAAAAGDIDFTLSPTGPIIDMVSNTNVPLVALMGQENADFLVASDDPTVKTCKDLAGHAVGVDTPGGARSTALRQMTAKCGFPFSSLQQVPLGAQTPAALIAGQIHIAVLHLDDLARVEAQLKHKVAVIVTLKEAVPLDHYNFYAARADKIKAHRDRYVRLVAALIDATNFLYDPKNADRVAEIATVTGHSKAEAKAALEKYLTMGFWAKGNDGLDRAHVEAAVHIQEQVGGIRPGKTPAPYDQLVDQSVWRDALALTRKR